jgi:hypothetical protein
MIEGQGTAAEHPQQGTSPLRDGWLLSRQREDELDVAGSDPDGDQHPKHHSPQSILTTLIVSGLIGTGLGFMGAGIDPGPGPRTVKGALTVGPLYLPPFLVGLIAVAIAGLVAAHVRWAPALGGALAAILLVGTATFGWAAVSYRLTHPGALIGFAEDTIQVGGELLAVGAAIALTVQSVRHHQGAHRAQRRAHQ